MQATQSFTQRMTLDEYLELDFEAEGRYEYFNGDVIEMSGGTPEHALLGSRVGFLLNTAVLKKGCFVYSSDVKIMVPAMPPYRYADVSARCGDPIYEDSGRQKLLANPTLIVEILSSSTELYDKDKKFKGYKSIESLREYVLISQVERFVVLYTKHNEKFWFQSEYVEGETLKLESIECELKVDDIYEGII